MMIRIFLCALVFVGFPLVSAHAAGAESIAVVVNEDAITQSDLQDRLRLIMVSSGMPDSEDIRSKLLPQIVGVLVDEQIRVQEAKKKGVEIPQTDIDAGFADIAKQNNFTPEQFKEVLKRGNINIDTLYAQIKAQVAWIKLVQKELRPRISVSDSDVDNKLALLRSNIGKNEYLTAEIFLPVDDVKKESDTRQLAMQLANDIRGGKARFSKVAMQFSKGVGSSIGGDLGWVQQGQLDPELDTLLPHIGVGKISEPVRTLAGYHILMVREQRMLSEQNMPGAEDVRNLIGQERLERQARRYFLDLKSSAFIDNRLGT